MMLSYFTVNLMLSALAAAQAHGGPGTKPYLSFAYPLSPVPRDAVRGCGTLVDDTGLGHTMISDEQCNSIGRKAESINIGAGCICVAFSKEGCSVDKPEHWEYLSTGPNVNANLKGRKVKWYQCSTDEKWAIDWEDRMTKVFGPLQPVPQERQH